MLSYSQISEKSLPNGHASTDCHIQHNFIFWLVSCVTTLAPNALLLFLSFYLLAGPLLQYLQTWLTQTSTDPQCWGTARTHHPRDREEIESGIGPIHTSKTPKHSQQTSASEALLSPWRNDDCNLCTALAGHKSSWGEDHSHGMTSVHCTMSYREGHGIREWWWPCHVKELTKVISTLALVYKLVHNKLSLASLK